MQKLNKTKIIIGVILLGIIFIAICRERGNKIPEPEEIQEVMSEEVIIEEGTEFETEVINLETVRENFEKEFQFEKFAQTLSSLNVSEILEKKEIFPYDITGIKVLEDLQNGHLTTCTKVQSNGEDVNLNLSEMWFDFENNITKTDSKIKKTGEEQYNFIVYQDAGNGFSYQCEDLENEEWTKNVNEPYDVSETIEDFAFEYLCGDTWYLDSETEEEIHLTRSMDDMLNSDFMESGFLMDFSEQNMEYKEYIVDIIIDKETNCLKEYYEKLVFSANKITEGGFDDSEQEEYEAYFTIKLDEVDEMEEIIIPEDVLNALTEEEREALVVEELPEITLPQKVIIDTDYASDGDDILALELAMVYDNHDVIEILGVVLSTTYSRSPMAVHRQLSRNGYGYVPVGMDTIHGLQVATQYVDVMYEGGSSEYEQPVSLYRRLLASSDSKVDIITLGFTQNLEDLLKSQPDGISPLNGVELVAEKVNAVYIMGGNLKGRPSFNFYWGERRNTTEAIQYVNKNLPVKLVYITEEMGNDVFCGGFYNQQDKKQTNIITKGLKANKQEYGVVAWDPFAVYCMVADIQGTLEENDLILKNGIPYISSTGAFEWTDTGETVTGKYMFEKSRDGGEYNHILNQLLNETFTY